MYPAMCFDTSMLVSMLIFVLMAGAAVATPIIFAVIFLLKRFNARQDRLAAGLK